MGRLSSVECYCVEEDRWKYVASTQVSNKMILSCSRFPEFVGRLKRFETSKASHRLVGRKRQFYANVLLIVLGSYDLSDHFGHAHTRSMNVLPSSPIRLEPGSLEQRQASAISRGNFYLSN